MIAMSDKFEFFPSPPPPFPPRPAAENYNVTVGPVRPVIEELHAGTLFSELKTYIPCRLPSWLGHLMRESPAVEEGRLVDNSNPHSSCLNHKLH